jgi:hypothetical protein
VRAAMSSCASFGVRGSRLAKRRSSQTTVGLSSSDDWSVLGGGERGPAHLAGHLVVRSNG